jgi:hypothetical protein
MESRRTFRATVTSSGRLQSASAPHVQVIHPRGQCAADAFELLWALQCSVFCGVATASAAAASLGLRASRGFQATAVEQVML